MKIFNFLLLTLFFLFSIFSSCVDTKNVESRDLENGLILKLQTNNSFKAFNEFNNKLLFEYLDYCESVNHNMPGALKFSFAEYLEQSEYNDVDGYIQYIYSNHTRYIKLIFTEVSELATLNSKTFQLIWKSAKDQYIEYRNIPCILEAWARFDDHTLECLRDVNQGGSMELYLDCLGSAVNNFIFETDLCD